MRHLTDQFRVRLNGHHCVYCGDVATTDDHWPPLAATGPNGKGLILPACRQCNNIAGAFYPNSFSERAQHVKNRLRFRLRKYLTHIEWDNHELREISPKLRREIAGWNAMRRIAHERIAWNADVAFTCIVHSNDFARISAALGFTEQNTPPWFEQLRSACEMA